MDKNLTNNIQKEDEKPAETAVEAGSADPSAESPPMDKETEVTSAVDTSAETAAESEDKTETEEQAELTDADDDVENTEEAGEPESGESEEETKADAQSEKKPRASLFVPTMYALGILALAVIIALSFALFTVRTVTVEVGSKYSAEVIHDTSPLASLYSVRESAVDTETVGTYYNRMTFFGFIDCTQTVHIADRTPPTVAVMAVEAVQGDSLTAEDFIGSWDDRSSVRFSFRNGEPDTTVIGAHDVAVTATDEYGNTADLIARLTVSPFNTAVEVRSLCARPGERVSAEDFIESISDPTKCTVTYVTAPDCELVGVQNVVLLVEDIYGNRSEIGSKLFICDMPAELYFEYGTSVKEITSAILDGVGEYANRFRLAVSSSISEVGEHEITVSNTLGEYTVRITVKDTVAPILTLQDVTVFLGDAPVAEELVVSCDELSEVSYSFEALPELLSVGSHSVTVIAEDAHGNRASGEAVIRVIEDVTPPQIYGVQNITITKGSSVSFRSGVSAVDNRDGEVTVQVDSSAVNTNEPGTYPVYYSATDAAGNTSYMTAYLTVSAITNDTLNSLADGVLAYIVTTDMTPREKAWAIYIWCTGNIRYSTRTSYLMGNYVEGAYSGFTTRSGNCYIYYAVASALLTRAGIENIEIQRDNPTSPHYWNLVNIDGAWYHFDTCPHYSGHHLECFLLTDAEVREYSENEVQGYYSFDSSLYPATP